MLTGPRYLEDGLVVPGCFKAKSNEKALIQILENELTHLKKGRQTDTSEA